ncbi:Cuticle protein 19 [Eumeta japonica]|uniref:Cuticle protein 19 n=1 Tax=Eumeta variegata TaxID=151549 RepID=A0A4C1XH24_EUMVA|nr:Cuticle protein 19 [Eumeta japonica]
MTFKVMTNHKALGRLKDNIDRNVKLASAEGARSDLISSDRTDNGRIANILRSLIPTVGRSTPAARAPPILSLSAAVAVAQAGLLGSIGHGYGGHAISSQQNIVHHDTHYAAPLHYSAPVHYSAPALIAAPAHHEDHYGGHDEYAHPKYHYSYSVEDPHTGDHKSQHEARDGDVVKGEYSLLQPDGTFRKVSYSADDHHG